MGITYWTGDKPGKYRFHKNGVSRVIDIWIPCSWINRYLHTDDGALLSSLRYDAAFWGYEPISESISEPEKPTKKEVEKNGAACKM